MREQFILQNELSVCNNPPRHHHASPRLLVISRVKQINLNVWINGKKSSFHNLTMHRNVKFQWLDSPIDPRQQSVKLQRQHLYGKEKALVELRKANREGKDIGAAQCSIGLHLFDQGSLHTKNIMDVSLQLIQQYYMSFHNNNNYVSLFVSSDQKLYLYM